MTDSRLTPRLRRVIFRTLSLKRFRLFCAITRVPLFWIVYPRNARFPTGRHKYVLTHPNMLYMHHRVSREKTSSQIQELLGFFNGAFFFLEEDGRLLTDFLRERVT